jgi:hypothetical protein
MNFIINRYNTFSKLETEAKQKKKYSEFIMLIVYIVGFIHLITILLNFFGIDVGLMLAFPLLFALIYIECKRDPNSEKFIYFFKVSSTSIFNLDSMVPFALLILSVVTGGDILSDIIGIASGHLYFYLKDMAPLHHGMDLLKTPQFLYLES